MKTAVKWFANELLYLENEYDMKLINKNEYQAKRKELLKQAKEMEKEQMKRACIRTEYEDKAWQNLMEKQFEQYYNETFKSE